jgi:down-regulator of transcription 1
MTDTPQGREKKANKFANSAISMEELERLQQEAFADAANRHA